MEENNGVYHYDYTKSEFDEISEFGVSQELVIRLLQRVSCDHSSGYIVIQTGYTNRIPKKFIDSTKCIAITDSGDILAPEVVSIPQAIINGVKDYSPGSVIFPDVSNNIIGDFFSDLEELEELNYCGFLTIESLDCVRIITVPEGTAIIYNIATESG